MKSKDILARVEMGTLILAILFAPSTYLLQVPAIDNYFGYRGNDGFINQLNSKFFDNEPHDPIFINDDNDFVTLGFPGSGIESDPYRIDGYNITSSSNNLIEIRGTSVYFQILNNWLDGLGSSNNGIFLVNVENALIINNILMNSQSSGILLSASNYNAITNNTSYQHGTAGIELSSSTNNTISNNTSFDNGWDGIRLTTSYNNTVSRNTAYNNSWKGIRLESQANNNEVINNIVYNNFEDGIAIISSTENNVLYNTAYDNQGSAGISIHTVAVNNFVAYNTLYGNAAGINLLWSSDDNDIFNNFIFSNEGGLGLLEVSNNMFRHNSIYDSVYSGIFIEAANNNTFTNNEIFENVAKGVFVVSGSQYNLFTSNVIHNNFEHGIGFGTNTKNNIVENNDFRENMFKIEEILDDGQNIIVNNYYEDWSGVGGYQLDGGSNNVDNSPIVNPNHISNGVISTEEAATSSGEIMISWSNASDIFHAVSYSLYYSLDIGTTWKLVISDINELNYLVDQNSIGNETNIIFKIQVIDDVGFVSEFITGESLVENSQTTNIIDLSNPIDENITSSSELQITLNFNFVIIGLLLLVLIPAKRRRHIRLSNLIKE